MSPSIHLANLSWSTPEGSPLLSDLDLTFGTERTGIVGRNGAGKSTLLRLIAGHLVPTAGHIHATGTVGLMRQDALERPGDTIADLFGVRGALEVLDRAETGRATLDDMADADWTLPARIEAALTRCDLAVDPRTPLATLSGGQRNRAALAALILAEPDFLLLDEPTNNLDRVGRAAIRDLVQSWTGGAIIVSHDRALLEAMDAIVELSALGARRYGGNFSAYRQSKAAELEVAQRHLAQTERAHAEAARRAQQAAERKARKDGAGAKLRAKGGQPKVLMDAARGRAEASGGAGARLREARKAATERAVSAAREKIEILKPTDMDVPETGLPPGRTVLRLNDVTFGYAPAKTVIRNLSLEITGPERVVIAGPNGSGKSTLLKLVSGQIDPTSGDVHLPVRFGILDQHVSLLDPRLSLRGNFSRLTATSEPQRAHATLARFGFRAEDALRIVGDLSGGERLRVGLACALGSTPPPMLLILDEPTNHLDLEGIAALEAAVASFDGAILAVSHDEAFLASLAPGRIVELPG